MIHDSNGPKVHLRSRSRSNSFDDIDLKLMTGFSSPVRGTKRVRSDNRHLRKYVNKHAATTSVEPSIIANELSTKLNAELCHSESGSGFASGMRKCIIIVAAILVLFQVQWWLLRSTASINVNVRSSKQFMHTISDTNHFRNVSIKELRINSFVRSKQYDAAPLKLLENVKCPNDSQNSTELSVVKQKQQLNQRNDKIPAFIIAGAQKSGTSALYTMIPKMQQYTGKRIRRSKRFETHFFYRYVNTVDNYALNKSDVCHLRQMYQQEFVHENDTVETSALYNDVVTFEKSPIYLCKPQLPSLIYQVVPWTKILLILRNPIDRVFSQWKMEQARQFANYQGRSLKQKKGGHSIGLKSFIDMVDDEVKILRQYQLSRAPNLSVYVKASIEQRKKVKIFRIPKSVDERVHGLQRSYLDGPDGDIMSFQRRLMSHPLSRGMDSQQIYFWVHPMHGGVGQYRINQNIKILHYEKFVRDRTSVLQETMEFLGMPLRKHPNGTTVDPQHDMFDMDHSPGSYTLEERKSMWNTKTLNIGNKTTTNGTISVKQYTTLDNIQDIVTLDELLNIQMDDIVREYLRKFYQPYNDELVQHLGNNWKNIWN